MARLARGANQPVSGERIEIRLAGPHEVDILGLLVDERLQARSDDDLVFWNAPRVDGLRWVAGRPAHLVLEPHLLPGSVAAALVVLALPDDADASAVADLSTAELVLESGTRESICVPLAGLSHERAVIAAEVYRRAGAWKVRSVVQGFVEGLSQLLTVHGIDVDEPAPTEPAPTEPAPTEPAPTEPAPSEPAPTEPAPTEQVRTEAGPTQPLPAEPAPTRAMPSPSHSGQPRRPQLPSRNEVDYAERAWLIWEDASRAVSSYRSACGYALSVRENELAGHAQRTSSHDILRAARERLDGDVAHLSAELAASADLAPAAMADWSSPHWLTWRPGPDGEPGVLAGHLTIEDAPGLRVPLILRSPWRQSLWLSRGALPGDSVAFCWSLITRYLAALPAGSVAVEVVEPSGLGGLGWLHSLPAPVGTGVLGGVASGPERAAARLGQLLDIVDLRAIGADDDALALAGGRPLRIVVVMDPGIVEYDENLLNRLLRLSEDGPRLGVATVCVETDTPLTDSLRMLRIRQSGSSLPSGDSGMLNDPWVRSDWSFVPAVLPDAGGVLAGASGSAPALLRQALWAQQEAGA